MTVSFCTQFHVSTGTWGATLPRSVPWHKCQATTHLSKNPEQDQDLTLHATHVTWSEASREPQLMPWAWIEASVAVQLQHRLSQTWHFVRSAPTWYNLDVTLCEISSFPISELCPPNKSRLAQPSASERNIWLLRWLERLTQAWFLRSFSSLVRRALTYRCALSLPDNVYRESVVLPVYILGNAWCAWAQSSEWTLCVMFFH